ncbi:NADH-quinone oxidoreductase subunit C [Dehalobacterium formicoaceticum]|uniref:hydrogenase large subunit n=1 Tax=Dehalobacterium formicoaceticum TaxID=51515 RepID=UPI001FA84F84|nr:NADH-quinone oxidoreductase subunit C [Dehalobacterium formicoaceticum]
MNKKDYRKILVEKFADHIISQKIAHTNEFYLEVNPRIILEIITFIDQELNCPLISMFANDERILSDRFVLYYAFADRDQGVLLIIKTGIAPEDPTFTSIAVKIPGAAVYEREIKDLFGLIPQGHPDPKRLIFHSNWPKGIYPLRKDFNGQEKPPFDNQEMPFTQVMGDGVYEIPVGPVHAGIIEPGHFRFSVAGEPIINLEAQLYFVHKGIEKMCEGRSIEHCLYVAERISGDETFANSQAYCQAIEKIAQVTIPERAMYTRVIFGELERLTSHLGDLTGICTDVAYGFAASQFNMLRAWAYDLADELCGMRFLRSVNKLGGCRLDFVAGKEKRSWKV